VKPLGRKNYGSIGHLPNSRLGPADHCVTEGQARIATIKVRDKFDTVIVQEKLDGSNVGVCKVDGKILAITRAGWLAETSPYDQHLLFGKWVEENAARFDALLQEGERICGEWLLLAHGTRYNLKHEPFVAFDIMTGETRLPFTEFMARAEGFVTPKVLSVGPAFSVEAAMEALGEFGHHGALDEVEGAVWRIERKGKVDYLTKFVKPTKVDGKYFKEKIGIDVWNPTPKGPQP
jgi:ATP-dependent RNA circularization protein (DNA/RNA ligase family)